MSPDEPRHRAVGLVARTLDQHLVARREHREEHASVRLAGARGDHHAPPGSRQAAGQQLLERRRRSASARKLDAMGKPQGLEVGSRDGAVGQVEAVTGRNDLAPGDVMEVDPTHLRDLTMGQP